MRFYGPYGSVQVHIRPYGFVLVFIMVFIKHEAKGNGGVLHVVSVREPSLTMLKELHFNPYAGYRRVQFQKKKSAKQFQNPETSSRSPKDDETREAVMDTAEPGTSADTEKPATSSRT